MPRERVFILTKCVIAMGEYACVGRGGGSLVLRDPNPRPLRPYEFNWSSFIMVQRNCEVMKTLLCSGLGGQIRTGNGQKNYTF